MGRRGGGGGHKGKRGGSKRGRDREPGGYARKDGNDGYKEIVRENETMVNYYKVSMPSQPAPPVIHSFHLLKTLKQTGGGPSVGWTYPSRHPACAPG